MEVLEQLLKCNSTPGKLRVWLEQGRKDLSRSPRKIRPPPHTAILPVGFPALSGLVYDIYPAAQIGGIWEWPGESVNLLYKMKLTRSGRVKQ